jgi:hypothetical protein
MPAKDVEAIDAADAIADINHRIRLLAILADAHAQLDRLEEMLEAFRAIANLRREIGHVRGRARLRGRPPIET